MGWTRMATTAALAAATWAAPATAQSPGYGGGRLPSAAVPRSGYVPTLGIALQPRGDRMALRFDTSLRCGRTSYEQHCDGGIPALRGTWVFNAAG